MSEQTKETLLSDLISASTAVAGEVDLERVLKRLVSEAKAATGARYGALGVLGLHGVLSDFIFDGIDEDSARRMGAPPQGRGVLGTVVRERTTIVLEDLSTHPDYVGFPDGHPPMSSFLGVPVRVGNEVYGNLYLTEKPGGFSDADVRLVESLAQIAGSAISTARLHERLRAIHILEDRNRIARELHDSIIQDLFAVGLSLQGLSDRVSDSEAPVLDQAVDQLHGAVEALRKYIYELRSTAEIRESMTGRLEELVGRMGNAYPTKIDLNVEGAIDSIEAREADEVIKLVTEALSNALRHSNAQTVDVTTKYSDRGLTLKISDDGLGFDPDRVERGMGLLNMSERVRRLGGEMQINSNPGGGTRLTIHFSDL